MKSQKSQEVPLSRCQSRVSRGAARADRGKRSPLARLGDAADGETSGQRRAVAKADSGSSEWVPMEVVGVVLEIGKERAHYFHSGGKHARTSAVDYDAVAQPATAWPCHAAPFRARMDFPANWMRSSFLVKTRCRKVGEPRERKKFRSWENNKC